MLVWHRFAHPNQHACPPQVHFRYASFKMQSDNYIYYLINYTYFWQMIYQEEIVGKKGTIIPFSFELTNEGLVYKRLKMNNTYKEKLIPYAEVASVRIKNNASGYYNTIVKSTDGKKINIMYNHDQIKSRTIVEYSSFVKNFHKKLASVNSSVFLFAGNLTLYNFYKYTGYFVIAGLALSIILLIITGGANINFSVYIGLFIGLGVSLPTIIMMMKRGKPESYTFDKIPEEYLGA